MELFTEDVWPLIWLLGFLELALVIALFATGRGKYMGWMLVPIGVAVLLLLIEGWIVTDREQIDDVVVELARSVEREDAAGMVRHFSRQAQIPSIPMLPQANLLEQRLRGLFERVQVDRVSMESRRIAFKSETQAECDFHATARASGVGEEGVLFKRWKLTFEKQGADWKVVQVEMLRPLVGNAK